MLTKLKRSGLLDVLLISFTILLFFGRFLSGDNLLFLTGAGWSDMVDYNFPQRVYLSEQLKQNNIPIWVSYAGNGFPYLAEAEAGVFYPVNLILFRFLNPALALNWSLFTALIILGVGCYFFSRQRGLGRLLSVYTGVLTPFTGYFIGHLHNVQVIQSAVFAPWGFLLAERLATKPKLIDGILLSIVFSLSLLAGHLPTTYSVILFTGIYFLVRLELWKFVIGKNRNLIKSSLKPLFYFSISLVFTFLVCAIQIFPTLEMIPYSTRPSGDEYEKISSKYSSLPFGELLTFINPYYYGDPSRDTYHAENFKFWEYAGYLGLIPLVLALLAFFLTKLKYLSIKIMIIVSWFIVLGQPSPLFQLVWHYLPGLNFSRLSSRYMLFVDIFMILLSAYALMWLSEKIKQTKPGYIKYFNIGVVICLLVAVADLWLYFYPLYSPMPTSEWIKTPQTVEFFRKDRDHFRVYTISKHLFNKFTLETSEGWRGDLTNFLFEKEMLASSLPTLFKVPSTYFSHEETGSFSLKRKAELLAMNFKYGILRQYSSKILGLQNVKYIISHAQDPLPEGENFKKVLSLPAKSQQIPNIEVYENLDFLPRAFFIEKGKIIKEPTQIINYMISNAFHPEKEVILEKEVSLPVGTSGGEQKIELIKNEEHEIIYKVATPNSAYFVLSDTWYPGWVATVDGSEVEILRANYAFRAVIVSEGQHEIQFKYNPQSFYHGSLITGVSLAAIMMYLFYYFFVLTRKK